MPYDISLDKNKTAVLMLVLGVLLLLVFLAGLISGFLVESPDRLSLVPEQKTTEKAAAKAVVKRESTPVPAEKKAIPVPSPVTAKVTPAEKISQKSQEPFSIRNTK